MFDYSTSELKVFQFIHSGFIFKFMTILFWVSNMKIYYVCFILIYLSTRGTLLHFKVKKILLYSPFWPFEYLKLLKPMLRCVPALVPGLPPPRCVLLHPAQRGQPLQLAQQLRQVRELALVTRRPCSCCRGTMLPLSRYDDVRTEERMNLEDCYQHCKVCNNLLL